MVFFEDIPDHSIVASLKRLGDALCLSKWLFCRLYKYAKAEQGKQYHTSFFKLDKKLGIKMKKAE